ncbi:MAG: DUF1521 domain-containing protein [Proteobacteria bacterium]|nr:DUF1521 domain-containing protein [Pseudomonadota bacterium]
MPSIESTSSTPPSYDVATAAVEAANTNSTTSTTSASSATSTAASSSSVDTLLSDVQKQASALSSSSTTMAGPFGKIIEAMVGLVSALIGLITNMLGDKKADPIVTKPTPVPVTTTPGTPAPVTTTPGTPVPTTPAPVTPAPGTSTEVLKAMQAIADDSGAITVRTPDGYVVKAEGKEQAWSITGPDGKTTRIWGDPHVVESDGDRWDFKERGSFMFGANKITAETVPAGNGQTLSYRLTVYSGNERVTVGGINTNKPVIVAVGQDGKQHDDQLADGTQYTRSLGANGEAWSTIINNKKKVMN